MGAYFVRRLFTAIPVLLLISLIAYFVLSLAPGDPIVARLSPDALAHITPEQLDAKRHELGLDGPFLVRYLRWLVGVAQGDFGYSIVSGRAVTSEIAARIGPTVYLMGLSMLIALGIGIPFGVISAVRQHGRLDYALTGLTMFMISTPIFVIELIGIYLFGVSLKLVPVSGMFTFGIPFNLGDRLAHVIMPATVLAFAYAAPLMRYTRASMIEVLNSDFIVTARSKGLHRRVVLVRHALRTALLPIITVVALLLPELVTGAVVTEQVFAWPGLGQLAVRAANDRDPALMMGTIMIVGVAVLGSALLADMAYSVADPRVRFDRGH